MRQSRRHNWTARLVAALGAILLAALPAIAGGTAGDLDTSFGIGGVATGDSGPAVTAMAVQSDGKTVVAGTDLTSNGGRTWLLRRYTAAGALDTSFGVNGEARPFGVETTSAGLADLTLDSSNRVVATGTASFEIEVTTGKGKKKTTEIQTVAGFVTIRLDTAGDLDTTFGDGGIVALEVGDLDAPRGTGVAIAGDGRVVIAGHGSRRSKGRRGSSTTNVHLFVTRLETDGSLDTGFGSDGFATKDLGVSVPGALGLQSDGGIVVGSYAADSPSNENWAVSRFHSDGSIDTAFGTIPEPDFTFTLTDLAIDGTGRVVVGGHALSTGGTHADGVVVRYSASGSLEASFGSNGIARVGLPNENYAYGGVALQADGRILLAGWVKPTDSNGTSLLDEHAYVARFNAGGALDSTFGLGGIGDSLPIADRNFADRLAVAPDGGIHIAGIVAPYPGDDSDRDWFLARICD